MQALPDGAWRGYRSRVTLHLRWREGWQAGLLRRDELIPIPGCPVHAPLINRSLELLLPRLPEPGRFPLAWWVQSGAQLTLVLRSHREPPLEWLDERTLRHLEESGLEGLWINLHPATGRRLFAKRGWRLLWGQERSRDAMGNLHGPASFRQLSGDIARRAIDRAEAHLRPERGEGVVDLYCGIGSTLRRWRERGAEAVGVELGGEAAACARENAPGATVLRGCCAQRLPQLESWLEEMGGRRVVAYLNPPRTGLEEEVVAWIVRHRDRFSRLAYLSCSAGTQRRDLERLEEGGYGVEALAPFDFFPRTRHVENLALLA